MQRRGFLSAALTGLTATAARPIAGGFIDDSHVMGHRLRDRAGFGPARRIRRIPLVIVGGGMAGLCAAWRLDRRGFRDYAVLEMEKQAGGNSSWGENEISPYPWGAHYVPVPSASMRLARELMADLGVITGGRWEERYLCHDPRERLFLHGKWQEGIEPEIAATRRDTDQLRRFHQVMGEFSEGGEFRIPIEDGARRRADLDGMSMADWLARNQFDSPYLRWLVDYGCRDDYGAMASATSAWAGIHYFASRGKEDERGPLTWPEGNGWIARRLAARLGARLETGVFVHGIVPAGRGFRVLAGDVEYRTEAVIFAAPTYLARFLTGGGAAFEGEYSPWLTANLTLERRPAEKGAPPAWDSVIYGSPSLGYVDATHQSLRTHQTGAVWTYYWALAGHTPREGRLLLLEKDWWWWADRILADLERPHPDIRQCVRHIDILRLGHAMIRPAPGFLRAMPRNNAMGPGHFFLANSDLSGISIFEEAQYRGVAAADRALRILGGSRT